MAAAPSSFATTKLFLSQITQATYSPPSSSYTWQEHPLQGRVWVQGTVITPTGEKGQPPNRFLLDDGTALLSISLDHVVVPPSAPILRGNYLLAIGKLYDESPTSRVLLAHQLINLTDTDTDCSRETLWMLEVLHAWKEKGREGEKS